MIIELISGAMVRAGMALLLIGVIGLAVTGDDDGDGGAAATSDDKNKGGAHECEDQSTGA